MSIISDYMNHGWVLVPIPPGGKGPRLKGWNYRAASLLRPEDLTHNYGVGLAHAYSGTMALDIDNIDLTVKFGIDVEALYAANDAVTIESGREGHGKLLYKMPFGLALPSKQYYTDIRVKGLPKKQPTFDFRCGTHEGLTVQDVLPPTIHPDTEQPYLWSGGGHWSELPVIPLHLLAIWQDLLKTNTETVMVDGVDASWDEITDALKCISPDCCREDWIQVGMALHWAGTKLFREREAIAVWNEWSFPSEKYKGEKEIRQQWRSFKIDRTNPVTLGTLFQMARQGGWVRPTPDASDLFTATDVPVSADTIIQGLRPKPPDMDLSVWPEILRVRAEEVSVSVGCDPLVPLFAGLAAICGVVDARTRLEIAPGFQVPPVLWLMTLGDPADKKSPGSRPMLSPLKNIEIEDRPRYQKEVLDWEAREAAYSVAKKAFLDFAASPDALLGTVPPDMPAMPDAPVPVKITVSDITSQKLVRQAADRPRGMLCHLDEMSSWVKKLTDRSSPEDRSAWVVGYESERYEMDRVGAGAIHADNFAISIYGNIQPRVFKEHLESLTMDGLLQRFIPAVLHQNLTRLGQPIPEYLTHAAAWENTLRLVFALPPITYRFGDDAYHAYREFQGWYERAKRDERVLQTADTVMTAFGKLEGLAGRLILLFHVIEHPFSPTVDAEIVRRVVQVIRGYVVPAYRYTLGELSGLDTMEVWLTDHIIQHADKQLITLSEIYRSSRRLNEGLSIWNAKQKVMLGMDSLERAHWVKRSDDQKEAGKAEWLINPALKTMFADHRKAVIQAKQRVNDEMRNLWPVPKPDRQVTYGVDDLE